jgi:predicted lysophospholipase L1 biosynthesis ABC-type transport system permease subunit
MTKQQNETAAYNFYMILRNTAMGELPAMVTGFLFHQIHIKQGTALLKKEFPDVIALIHSKTKKVYLVRKKS